MVSPLFAGSGSLVS